MFRIAIVEDDRDYQNQLLQYCDKYAKENNEEFQTIVFSDGDGILDNYTANYDVIFMDIQMRLTDGMTTAKEIRKYDEKAIIIFVTNMSQYAIKGYEVGALGYVLKPISYFVFSQELLKALRKIRSESSHSVVLRQEDGMQVIDTRKIIYVESDNHVLTIHTDDGNFEMRGTMKEMEERLSVDSFARCNNSYLVNLKYVRRIVQNDVDVNGEMLPISRPRKKEFIEALTDYLGGM